MDIREITENDKETVARLLAEEWGSSLVVSAGKLTDAARLPGFLMYNETKDVLGLITYQIDGSACEVVTLNSFLENKGIGTALMDKVRGLAVGQGCSLLWLVTTNDNTHAIRYYQKYGFRIHEVRIGAIEASRKLKPSIPSTGFDGIPIEHELEFQLALG